MSASSQILSELADKERALSADLERARQEAARTIEAAEQEAARILEQARAQAAELSTQHAARLDAEQQRIRESERSTAQASVAGGGVSPDRAQQAIDLIMKAVLP